MIFSMKRIAPAFFLAPMFLAVRAAGAQEAEPGFTPADTLRAVEVSVVDVRPAFVDAAEVTRMVEAHYPPALKDGGVGGKVVVRLLVDVQGHPRLARVHESAGNAELDSAAMRVAAAARLTPARWAGGPYPVWLELPVSFVSPNAPSDTVKAAERPRVAPKDTVEELPELANRSEVGRLIGRQYPREMRDAGMQGSVTVRFRVSAQGIPESPRVDRASRPEFVEPAVRVVRMMRFRPARVNGTAVGAWVILPISFQLPPPPPPPAPPAWPNDRAGPGGRRP